MPLCAPPCAAARLSLTICLRFYGCCTFDAACVRVLGALAFVCGLLLPLCIFNFWHGGVVYRERSAGGLAGRATFQTC